MDWKRCCIGGRAAIGIEAGAIGMCAGEDALFVVEVAVAIARAKRLGIGGGVAVDRRAAASREDGGEGPTTRDTPYEALLRLVIWILNHGIDVVHELAIEVLNTIHVLEVERIVGSVLAGSLYNSSCTKSLAIGEVLLERDVMPVGHLKGDEGGIVVAIADTHVVGDTGGCLPTGAECRPGDWRVHHAAREIEPAIVQIAPQAPHRL